MSYFEPVCPHPQDWWEYLDCSCVICGQCGETIKWCNTPHCEQADYETAFKDEDVEDIDVDAER